MHYNRLQEPQPHPRLHDWFLEEVINTSVRRHRATSVWSEQCRQNDHSHCDPPGWWGQCVCPCHQEFRSYIAPLSRGRHILESLIAFRRLKGITATEVAGRMNLTRSRISGYEQGDKKTDPSIATIVAYADAVGLEIHVLIREKVGNE